MDIINSRSPCTKTTYVPADDPDSPCSTTVLLVPSSRRSITSPPVVHPDPTPKPFQSTHRDANVTELTLSKMTVRAS